MIWLTYVTALAAFTQYVGALVCYQWRFDSHRFWPEVARKLWTQGCFFMIAHMVLAFEAFHHWSHQAAYADTARRTAELTGLAWGGGIYANYAFVVTWLMDVIWWQLSPASQETRPKIITWFIQGFFAFMWFNATVVFGHGVARFIGVVGFLILTASWWKSRRVIQEKTASL